jgi:hypothetical protein
MAESDELKLTVTLVDNASAGLAKLQTQMQEIGGGQGAQNAQRAARNFQEMHERGLKPLFETIDKAGRVVLPEFARGMAGGISGMVAFGAGAATAGIAITKMLQAIADSKQSFNDFVNNSIKLSQLSTITGQYAADIEAVGEAYKRAGLSVEQGREDFVNASHALGDLSRTFSTVRQEALKGVLTPEQRANLVTGIGALARKDDVAGAMTLLREYAEQAKENAIAAARARGDSEVQIAQRGADAQMAVMNILGQHYLQYVDKPIKKATEERKQAIEAEEAAAKRYVDLSAQISTHWDHISSHMWAAVASSGPMLRAMERMNEILDLWEHGHLIPPNQPVETLPPGWKAAPGIEVPPANAPLGQQDKTPPPPPKPPDLSKSPSWYQNLMKRLWPGATTAPQGSDKPLGFIGGGDIGVDYGKGYNEMRASTNVEMADSYLAKVGAKVGGADLTKETTRLADEMKRLNDYLQLGSGGTTAPAGAFGLLGGADVRAGRRLRPPRRRGRRPRRDAHGRPRARARGSADGRLAGVP